jgi:hypothetical protein
MRRFWFIFKVAIEVLLSICVYFSNSEDGTTGPC